MKGKDPYRLRMARREADLLGAQRLRYRVFVEEMGGDGPLVDHGGRFERDRFDAHADHLILVDPTQDPDKLNHVVGAYRLMSDTRAAQTDGFYSASEYDLTPLLASGQRLLELGRSCIAPEHRQGAALMRLWAGLADHVAETGAEILFGVASFHGTDPAALAAPLSLLHHRHLAPPALRIRSKAYAPMNLCPEARLDRLAAAQQIPPLLKSYLRLGGYVGDGAFVDHAFNTTDVCLVMDLAQVPDLQKARYAAPP